MGTDKSRDLSVGCAPYAYCFAAMCCVAVVVALLFFIYWIIKTLLC